MAAHRQFHKMAGTGHTHEPGTNSTVPATEGGAIVEKTYGTATTPGLLVVRDANGDVLVPSTPTAATGAASKTYVDTKVAEGITWKEILLSLEQVIDGASGGISQAMMLSVTTVLTAGDLVKITNGTLTETWTAVAGAPAAFQFQVGASVTATIDNLVAAITADSTLWAAIKTTGLDVYFSAGPTEQIVVYRVAPSSDPDRMWGTLSTQADIQVREFKNAVDYSTASANSQGPLPSADPAEKRFGFGRLYAALIQGETHRVSNDNTAYTWDGDDEVWQLTSTPGGITAGDGIDITALKVSADVAVAATAERQWGAIRKDINAEGTGTATENNGYLAAQTDNVNLVVNASNQLALKAGSKLDKMKGVGAWTSSGGSDKEPDLTELKALLGTAAGDIGNWGILVEATLSMGTFLCVKVANADALTDYHLVELSAAA